jgi:hypothetical protein
VADKLKLNLLSKNLSYMCVSLQLKLEGVAGVADKLKLNPLSKNMLLALGEHNRFVLIPAVANLFATVMSAHR